MSLFAHGCLVTSVPAHTSVRVLLKWRINCSKINLHIFGGKIKITGRNINTSPDQNIGFAKYVMVQKRPNLRWHWCVFDSYDTVNFAVIFFNPSNTIQSFC